MNINYLWHGSNMYPLSVGSGTVANTLIVNEITLETDPLVAKGEIAYVDGLEGAGDEKKWKALGMKRGDGIEWVVKCRIVPEQPGDDEKEFSFTCNRRVNNAIKDLISAKLSHLLGYIQLHPDQSHVDLRERYSPTGSIRVVNLYLGVTQPEWIREAWLGVTIPLLSKEELEKIPFSERIYGKRGYIVLRDDAVVALNGANQIKASQYWSNLITSKYLEFKEEGCELIID